MVRHARIVCKALDPVPCRKVAPSLLLFDPVARSASVGLDLSLRGAGMAVMLDGKLHSATAWTDQKGIQKDYPKLLSWFKMKANTESDRQHRIDLITRWVCGAVVVAHKLASNVHVAFEGYAFSKRTTGLSDIHELGGAIKGWLWSRGVPYRTYDPMSIKLAWTGKGTAEKADMVAACHLRFPDLKLEAMAARSVETAGNIADATLIAALLHEELELKAGRARLEDLREGMRRVMIRTTKSEPEALVSRSFITSGAASPPLPTFATQTVA